MELNDENFQLILSYITECDKRYFDNYFHMYMPDEQGNLGCMGNEIFYYITDLAGYGGFPKILKDNDFEKVNRKLLYHGYDKHIHGANYLWDYRFHYGRGDYGQGTYFTTDLGDAKSFIGGYKWDNSLILRAKILPAKAIKYSTLKKIANTENINVNDFDEETIFRLNKIFEFIKSIDNKHIANVVNNAIFDVQGDYSSLAILLGFDVIENDLRKDFYEGKHYILLNRNKLLVPEKDAKALFNKANGKYKNLPYMTTPLSELDLGENCNG